VWQGAITPRNGYGRIKYKRRQVGVHQAAYREFIGPIPEGLEVQHSCNVRACWEPSHLLVGTHQQNCEYRATQGDQSRGERAGGAKLTEVQVRKILQSHGVSQTELARRYGVSQGHISIIRSGKAWKHISS